MSIPVPAHPYFGLHCMAMGAFLMTFADRHPLSVRLLVYGGVLLIFFLEWYLLKKAFAKQKKPSALGPLSWMLIFSIPVGLWGIGFSSSMSFLCFVGIIAFPIIGKLSDMYIPHSSLNQKMTWSYQVNLSQKEETTPLDTNALPGAVPVDLSTHPVPRETPRAYTPSFVITPLLNAIIKGDLELVRTTLQEYPEQLNIPYAQNGNTPLHVAAFNGYTEIVRFLLEQPTLDKTILNKAKKSALDIAQEKGFAEIAELLK